MFNKKIQTGFNKDNFLIYLKDKYKIKNDFLSFIDQTIIFLSRKNSYTLESYTYDNNNMYYIKSYLIDIFNIFENMNFNINFIELLKLDIITCE